MKIKLCLGTLVLVLGLSSCSGDGPTPQCRSECEADYQCPTTGEPNYVCQQALADCKADCAAATAATLEASDEDELE